MTKLKTKIQDAVTALSNKPKKAPPKKADMSIVKKASAGATTVKIGKAGVTIPTDDDIRSSEIALDVSGVQITDEPDFTDDENDESIGNDFKGIDSESAHLKKKHVVPEALKLDAVTENALSFMSKAGQPIPQKKDEAAEIKDTILPTGKLNYIPDLLKLSSADVIQDKKFTMTKLKLFESEISLNVAREAKIAIGIVNVSNESFISLMLSNNKIRMIADSNVFCFSVMKWANEEEIATQIQNNPELASIAADGLLIPINDKTKIDELVLVSSPYSNIFSAISGNVDNNTLIIFGSRL